MFISSRVNRKTPAQHIYMLFQKELVETKETKCKKVEKRYSYSNQPRQAFTLIQQTIHISSLLPSSLASAFKRATNMLASKLFDAGKLPNRGFTFLDNNVGRVGFLNDTALLISAESLLSGGGSGTARKVTGLSESANVLHVST